MTGRVEFAALADLPVGWSAAWDALAAGAIEPNPFYERWFVAASACHLPHPDDARVAAVFDGDTMIGLVPLHVAPRYGRMPVRHVENWLHYHAFDGAPLIAKGCAPAFWAALLGALDAAPWAPAFLHLSAVPDDAAILSAVARPADVVLRHSRAVLRAGLSSDDYYATHVRKKKRKELARLAARLAEAGPITFDRLTHGDAIAEWSEQFLALEAAGWKGRAGTALRDDPATSGFFTAVVAGAAAAGRLELVRLRVGGQPVAMLVNFITPPGSFSFKIAFHEDFARFSPGVLIQIENLKLLDRGDIAWMDSCAVAGHAMIESLWAERRDIVRVTIPLRGLRRRTLFTACRTLERGSAMVRGWR